MKPILQPLEDEESRRAFLAMSPLSRLWVLGQDRRLLMRALLRREDVPQRWVPLFRLLGWLASSPVAPPAAAASGYRDAPVDGDERLPDVRSWYRRPFSRGP
jgi:hypothetical protein